MDAKLRKECKQWAWMDNLVEKTEGTEKIPILVFKPFRKQTTYAVCLQEWFFDSFQYYLETFSFLVYSKGTGTFEECFKHSRKLSDNRIPGLWMKGGLKEYIAIRAELLQVLMKKTNMIGGKDEE